MCPELRKVVSELEKRQYSVVSLPLKVCNFWGVSIEKKQEISTKITYFIGESKQAFCWLTLRHARSK